MSSSRDRRRRMVRRATRRFGDDQVATLVRKHTIKGGGAGGSLVLAAGASQGSSAIVLNTRRGELPSGLQITINGISYYAAADAQHDQSAQTTTVSLTFGLQAAVLSGAALTIANSVTYTYPSMQASRELVELGETVAASSNRIHLEHVNGNPEPRHGDLLTRNGRRRKVESVSELNPGDGAGGWTVTLGDVA